MARYIDADLLTDKLEELQFNAPVMTPVMKIYNVIELVEDQPPADVEEVKHGDWKLYDDGSGVCKNCNTHQRDVWDMDNVQRFCCRCGAKMDGGGKQNDL